MLDILIVEIEKNITDYIKSEVESLNHNVIGIARTYKEAITLYLEHNPDIIFLGVKLKNNDTGIDVASKIREKDSEQIIIYISSMSYDEKTINKAFKTKPYGYIIKPFKKKEISISIRLALQIKDSLFIDTSRNLIPLNFNYFYDEDTEQLFYKNVNIKLSSKLSVLIKLLVLKRGTVVPFVELEESIWGNAFVKDGLKQLVYRLRNKTKHELILSFSTGYMIE